MPTPRGQLPYLASNQSQKEVTHNEALNILDILVDTTVIDMITSTPPGSPTAGDCYVVAATATDEWTGEEGNLAFYLSGWNFIEAYKGLIIYNEDDDKLYRHNGTTFNQVSGSIPINNTNTIATSPNNATTSDLILEELVSTPSGAFVDSVIQIPNRAIVEAVTVRTVTTVTGATSFDCGVAGNTSQFGGSLGVAAGSTNIGVIDPTAFYAATSIRLTANGGDFSGGAVRVAIHCRVYEEPQS